MRPARPLSGRKRRLGVRAGVAVALACGLAAGSYGIDSAASGSSARGRRLRALAVTSTPSKTSPASLPAPPEIFGRIGPLTGFGSSPFGEGGTITGLGATTITVETELGGTLTVTTDSSTIYREADTTVDRTALAVGQEVLFQPVLVPVARPGTASSLPVAGGSSVVRLVEIVLPSVSGKVVGMNGSQIVVAQLDGLYVTVNVSGSTKYEEPGSPTPRQRSKGHRRSCDRHLVVRPHPDRRHDGRCHIGLCRGPGDWRDGDDDHPFRLRHDNRDSHDRGVHGVS